MTALSFRIPHNVVFMKIKSIITLFDNVCVEDKYKDLENLVVLTEKLKSNGVLEEIRQYGCRESVLSDGDFDIMKTSIKHGQMGGKS